MTNPGTADLAFGTALTGRVRLVFSGLAIHATIGALFCWAAFLEPLQKVHGWTPSVALIPYRYALIWFTIGLFAASRIARRHSPRALSRFGGLLLVSGCLWAVADGSRVSGLATGIGVLCGLGAGFAYFAPIATFRHWLPPRGRLFDGLAVAGFVAGALFSSRLLDWVLSRPGAEPAASLEAAFLTLALLFAGGVVCMGEFLPRMRAWLAPGIFETLNQGTLPAAVLRERAWERSAMPLLRLWLEWSVFFVGLLASLGAIEDSAPLLGAVLGPRAPLFAGVGAIVLGLANYFGATVWKDIAQRVGGIHTLLIQALLAAGLALLAGRGRFEWGLAMAMLGVIGFGFGGFLGLMPRFAMEMLDRRESPMLRFAIVYSALGLCGTIVPFWLSLPQVETFTGNLSRLSFTAALLLGFLYLLLRPIRTGSTVSEALLRW